MQDYEAQVRKVSPEPLDSLHKQVEVPVWCIF